MNTTRLATGLRALWLTYLMAVTAAIAILFVRGIAGVRITDEPALLLFLLPIIFAGSVGGLGPGLVSTFVTALGASYSLLPPEHTFMLVLAGVLISVGSEALHRARRRAEAGEEALQQRVVLQERLVQIAATAPGVIFSFRQRPDGTVCLPYASPRIKEIYNLSPDQLAENAAAAFALMHSDDIGQVRATIAESARTLSRWHVEFRVLNPEKGEIWVEGHSIPTREPDGSMLWHGFLNDITERKRTEEALRKSEERYRTVVADQTELIARFATDGTLTFINDVGCRLAGKTSQELLGTKWQGFAVSEDLPRVLEQLRALTPANPLAVIENRMRSPSGEIRWMQFANRAFFDDEGRLVEIQSVGRDITERKQAEMQLAEREQQWDALIENIPLMVFVKDARDLRYVRINREGERLTGRKQADIIGRSDFDFSRREYAEYLTRCDRHVIESGELLDLPEDKMRTPEGIRIFHTRKVRVPGADGQPRLLLGISVDITDRKRAEDQLRRDEERLQLAMSGANDGLWDWNIKTGDAYYSPRWKSMLGYGEDELENVPDLWTQLIHPDDLQPALAVMQELIQARSEKFEIEFRMRHKDGHYRHILSRGFQSVDAGGEVVRLVGTHVDITDRRRAEQALRERESQYRAVIETAADGFWIVDDRGRFLEVNEAYQRRSGYSREELLRMRIADVEAHERSKETTDHFSKIRREGRDLFETLHRTKDGTIWHAEITAAYWPIAGGRVFAFIRDITERKAAEGAVRASEQRLRHERALLRALIDSIPDLIFFKDTNSVYLGCNKAFETYTGMPESALIGKTDSAFSSPHVADLFRKADQEMLSSRKTWQGEEWVPVKYGEAICFDTLKTPYYGPDGEVLGLIGLSRDITKRKQAEQQQRLQAAALESAANGIVIADRSGTIQWVNRAFTNLTGYSAAEAIGKNPRILKSGKQDAEVYKSLWGTVLAGRVWQGEIVNKRKDGTYYTEEMTITPVRTAGGDISHFVAIKNDVTERKEAEDALRRSQSQLQLITDAVPALIAYVDIDGRQRWINRTFERWFGDAAESNNGRHVREMVGDAAWQQLRPYFERALAGEEVTCEREMASRQGRSRWFRVTYTPDRDATGAVVGVVALAHDITQAKRSEESMSRSHKLEALGTLAGGIAHDFNNILGAIFGNIELASQDVGTEHPATESLDEIRKASRRAKELVQRILAFSRQQPQSRSVTTLRPLVEEAVKFLHASLPASVELITAIEADTPAVLADPTQIEQVLLNLCTNAWQALEGRAGRIEIRLDDITLDAKATVAHANLAPGHFARLTVTDTGNGMDGATLERIFEPFFTTKPPGVGTGLGLSVVHGIVEAHDGAISVSSQPGSGTTFTLYFPAATAPQASAAPEPTAGRPRLAASGKHVLYLDDEEPLVFLVTRLLERLGYRVSGYTRPAEALAAIRANPGQFDLVVTDFDMPGTSGLDVARELASLRPDLPVVLASGYITEELQALAPQAGVRHLIYKPDTVEELCTVVQRLTGELKPAHTDVDGYGTDPSS